MHNFTPQFFSMDQTDGNLYDYVAAATLRKDLKFITGSDLIDF